MIQGIIQLLVSDTGVRHFIGLNKASARYKVFPVVADQDEKPPYTVGTITGNTPDNCKDCVTKTDRVSFDLITYSREYEELDNIDNQMRFILDNYKGTSSGIVFEDIRFRTHRDLFDNEKSYFARLTSYDATVKRTKM